VPDGGFYKPEPATCGVTTTDGLFRLPLYFAPELNEARVNVIWDKKI
jgi:hypothetical protein